MQSVCIALVTVFTIGAFCGGALYKAVQGPGAEYVARYSDQDRRDLRSVVWSINLEARNKARKK